MNFYLSQMLFESFGNDLIFIFSKKDLTWNRHPEQERHKTAR